MQYQAFVPSLPPNKQKRSLSVSEIKCFQLSYIIGFTTICK